jgi:hypothetical protein
MLLVFLALLLLFVALATASALLAARRQDEHAFALAAAPPVIGAALLVSLALLLYGTAPLWLQVTFVALVFLGLLRFSPATLVPFFAAPLLFLATLAHPFGLAAAACLLLAGIAFGSAVASTRTKKTTWFAPALTTLRLLVLPLLLTSVIVIIVSLLVT